jgi:hypothetical protein
MKARFKRAIAWAIMGMFIAAAVGINIYVGITDSWLIPAIAFGIGGLVMLAIHWGGAEDSEDREKRRIRFIRDGLKKNREAFRRSIRGEDKGPDNG